MVADFTVDKDTGTVLVDTFTLTNTTTPFAFTNLWSITPSTGVKFVGGTSASSQNIRLVFSNGGLYTVNLKASAGILSDDTTSNDLIFIGWGLNRQEFYKVVRFYPNPTNNIINIEGLNKNENNNIQIFDMQGKLVITKIFTEKVMIDLSELNNGVYVINIGEVAQRIVKM